MGKLEPFLTGRVAKFEDLILLQTFLYRMSARRQAQERTKTHDYCVT